MRPWPPAPLALLALLAAASPAAALPQVGPQGDLERVNLPFVDDVRNLGFSYDIWYDPESRQLFIRTCIERDADWHFPFDVGQDDGGYLAVWVPHSTDPSEGSDKASTRCVTTIIGQPAGA